MTTILCYGDSNTYGYNPVNGLRYPKDVRWTGVLQKLLGEQYAVIEEGCNGRTTVFEDIAFGPRNKGMQEEDVAKHVKDAMKFVGLDYDTFASRSPFQLSGGQMRRVAIAGVIAMNPDYLILDEPSAGLDPRSREAVFAEIMALYKKRQMAVILVTHSMEEAARYSNRLLVIAGGKIILDGKPADIYQQHKDELLAVSMDVPQLFKLSDELRKRGMAIEQDTMTVEALEAQIKTAKGLK